MRLMRSLPAMMHITAMRTAMPKVTCGRITLCAPSTTAESISTPRLIGPGCMTIASGLASAQLLGREAEALEELAARTAAARRSCARSAAAA